MPCPVRRSTGASRSFNRSLMSGRARSRLAWKSITRTGRCAPGYATVQLNTAGRRAVTVPLAAVLPTGTHNIVFVNRGDGRFLPRDVRVGQHGDSLIEIVEGLQPGDEVIASATFLLDSESNLAAAIQGLMLQMGMGLNMGGMQMPPREGERRP